MWLAQFQPLLATVPTLTNPGNHEVGCDASNPAFPSGGPLFSAVDSGGECGYVYEALLPMPNTLGPNPAGLGKQWYGVGVGPLYFISLSTEQVGPLYGLASRVVGRGSWVMASWVMGRWSSV